MGADPAAQEALWEAVNQAFAPFAGTPLYAVRAELFFHLTAAAKRPLWSGLKNLCYPGTLAWRARELAGRETEGSSGYLFVCDYAAEAGFGSLRPLLTSCETSASIVVNTGVQAVRGRELAGMPRLSVVCADAGLGGHVPGWVQFWGRSWHDYQALLASAPRKLRRPVEANRRIVRTLLVRAYFYEALYERLFAANDWRAAITHNDFTALSFLAGEAARRHGVPDFTLQHGFPSMEYFPTSASHYLVWGPKLQDSMAARQSNGGTEFAAVGAPRLDGLFPVSEARRMSAKAKFLALGLASADQLNVLFLSQQHSPVFSPPEHHRVLALVAGVAAEPWLRLMVRRHPQERTVRRNGLSAASVIPRELSLVESLLAADVVISVNSTAMLEAALLRRPVVQIALPGTAARLGPLRFPQQMEDVRAAHSVLRRLCHGRERLSCVAAQEPLVRACVANPGQGTESAWRYIRALCEQPRPSARAATMAGG
jgi:hypothetical protein